MRCSTSTLPTNPLLATSTTPTAAVGRWSDRKAPAPLQPAHCVTEPDETSIPVAMAKARQTGLYEAGLANRHEHSTFRERSAMVRSGDAGSPAVRATEVNRRDRDADSWQHQSWSRETSASLSQVAVCGGVGSLDGPATICKMDRRDRIARRASAAAQAAALRAEAARRRGAAAELRVAAIREQAAHGPDWTTTAAERAAAAVESARAARAHAAEALDRSAEAHDASARAHERTAATLEGLGRIAAATRHRESAIEARVAADRDHRAAEEARQSIGEAPADD